MGDRARNPSMEGRHTVAELTREELFRRMPVLRFENWYLVWSDEAREYVWEDRSVDRR